MAVKILGVLFLLVGLMTVAQMVGGQGRLWYLGLRGIRTTGRVADRVAHHGDVERVEAEFGDRRGERVTVSFHVSELDGGEVVPIGGQFEVLHPVAEPEGARPAGDTGSIFRGNPFVVVFRFLLLALGKELKKERRTREHLRSHGVRATATVTRHQHSGEEEWRGDPVLCPLIEFTDRRGRTRSFTSPAYRGDRLPAVGREIPVVYLSDAARSRLQTTPDDIPSGRHTLLGTAVGGFFVWFGQYLLTS